jgi:hypothetical protein
MGSKIFNNTKNKQTMKIKVSKTIEEEMELTLPAYRKGSCHWFKIISDKLAIQVTDLDGWNSIQQTTTGMALTHGIIECTEREFNSKYEEISHILLRNVVDQYDEEEYDESDRVNRNVEASEGMER